MKKSISLLLLLASSMMAGAAPRTAADAIKVAQQFAATVPSLRNASYMKMTLSEHKSAKARSVNGTVAQPSYYIVNLADERGFIVVSGDDRFKPVLGYCDQGNVTDESDMPETLQYWLSSLSNEMEYAKANGYEAREKILLGSQSESIEPLITCKWDQGSPYNKLIPNYATGCVATGLAQLMYYWKYPTNGIGKHTNGNALSYSADFAATTYDWANMKDTYGGKYDTAAQIDAVATLMYHIGVATDMSWNAPSEGSSTGPINGAYALVNFFGYNKNLHPEDRDCFSLGAWKNLILGELKEGRPIAYTGVCDESGALGHFFILDGYDAETGLFHFNWGWSGKYNGYFDITSLEPGTGGTGAGMGSYNYFQEIYVGVQPEEMGEYIAHFDAQEIKPASKTMIKSNVTFSTTVLGYHAINFKGCMGLAIYNADGELIKFVKSDTPFPAGYYPGNNLHNEHAWVCQIQDINDGEYTVCLASQHESYPDKVFPVRANYGNATYFTMSVKGNDVTISDQKADYYISDIDAPVILTSDTKTLYQNVVSKFSVQVKNTGTTEFNDEIGVCIKKTRDSKPQYIVVPCSLLPGEEKTVTVSGKVFREPGNYTLVACYGENGSYSILDNSYSVTVADEETSVSSVNTESQNASVYTLSGIRVNNADDMPKGTIHIRGNEKIKK